MSNELFEAVRAAASPATWSRGVELCRAEAVTEQSADDDEIVLRVAPRSGLVTPTVILQPDDVDWDCDCGTREDACEHVAAAVIAIRRAERDGRERPGPARAPGHVAYRLTRENDGIALERVVTSGSEEVLLRSTLAAVASGRVQGPEFAATPADLAAERVLGPKLRGRVARGVLPKLLGALAACDDVRLDGSPVRTSGTALGWTAILDDDGAGFRLRVQREEPVEEVFDGNVALVGGTLRPLAPTPLSGRELEDLAGAGGRHFGPDEAARLASEVLPELDERLPVEIRSRRLPRAVREPPRLVVELARRGDELEAFATLVYGDPPRARIDAGRLVPLGGGALPLRDEAAERGLLRRLQNELELLPGRRVRLGGEAALRLADAAAGFPCELRGDGGRDFFRAPTLEPRLGAAGRDLDLAFECEVAGERRSADPGAVLRAWREGEGLVPLAGGGLAPLPGDWLRRYGDRIADLLAAREVAGELPRALLPELAELCQELGAAPPDLGGLAQVLGPDGAPPAARLPDDLGARLRDYQRRGVDWLCALRDAGLGALLADDMGLGKTLQALCALRGRSLVVAPTSVLPSWQAECARFRPALRCCVYHGPGRRLDPDADLTLTSYAILRLDAERLCAEPWDSVVLDEAQSIKNPDSQVARAANRLGGTFRVALTGTPVENRLDELWSQLHFALPGLLGTRRDFDRRIARPIARGDEAAAERLRARIRPFVLRRLKREVAPELPPRTEVVLHAELSPEERRVYDAVRAATRDDVVRQLTRGGSLLGALEALLRLRQAACHPALVPGQDARSSAKLEVLVDRLDQAVAEGHKALIFSQWTSLLDLAEAPLREAGLAFTRLDGATRDRAGVVASFQSPDGPPLLLISLRAGGVGLTLTAADHVFLLDPWWNPAVEDQAADRTHRIGQDRPVVVTRIVARDTVEERILALQARKRELLDVALGGGAAEGLTREELLALLD